MIRDLIKSFTRAVGYTAIGAVVLYVILAIIALLFL